MTRTLSLLQEMTKRELFSRYKGSLLGFSWVLVNPLLMLCVYVFVFSEVFRVKWPSAGAALAPAQSQYEFGLMLMIGLSVFQFFSETLSKSPSTIVGNPNLVTKVLFPTQLLPLSTMLASFVHFAINIVLIVVGALLIGKSVGSGYPVSILMGALMFLTPVFFPASSFPVKFRAMVDWNPMAFYIEAFRSIIGGQEGPSILMVALSVAVGALTFLFGMKVFTPLKKGFADVL
jgi:lipopolysaccharide transport system permease protein